MTTIDIIKELILDSGIASVRIVKFNKSQYVQDNPDINTADLSIVSEAINIKGQYDIPFWDAVNIANCNSPLYSCDLIKLADHHNVSQYRDMGKEDFLPLFSSDTDNPNTGINSRVTLSSGETRHIPMMDFHIGHSANSLDIIKSVCGQLNQKEGYIIDSGASYHYLGTKLMDEEAFISFLAHSLLFSPIVDNRWIAHQLIERSATLRIGRKNNILPKVIVKLG